MKSELVPLLRLLSLLWASAVAIAATLDLVNLLTEGDGITASLLRTVGTFSLISDPHLYFGAWMTLCVVLLFVPIFLLLTLASKLASSRSKLF